MEHHHNKTKIEIHGKTKNQQSDKKPIKNDRQRKIDTANFKSIPF